MRTILSAFAIAAASVTTAAASPGDLCKRELDARGVAWKPAHKPGITIAIEVTGPLGGIAWAAAGRGPLVLDCSLAVSLAEAGPYLAALGVERATFSSAYARRNVRGTNKPSKHSYGLAIDVSRFHGTEIGDLAVALDYEQGLGDAIDCLGQPSTQGGAILKVLQCQLVRSGLFYLVLSPDYDDAHHDHFHLEARPWTDRTVVRGDRPAIH